MSNSSLPRAPKVFISHASEDRDRFVVPLGVRLRQQRVDAWVSSWEMRLGDRLVDKVFEEGLGTADWVVIVVSDASIDKPWVQAEMEVATAQRIAGTVRVIAVLLEGTRAPTQLTSIVWHAVPAISADSIEAAAAAITKAVYEVSERPPLGDAPGYVRALAEADLQSSPGLARTDTLVLREAVRQSLEHEHANFGHPLLGYDEFAAGLGRFDLSAQDVADAVEVLTDVDYVRAPKNLTRRTPSIVQVTTAGVEDVIESVIDGYATIRRAVAAAIVNEGLTSSGQIAETAEVSQPVVHHILTVWADRGWLTLSKTSAPIRHVYGVKPQLKRWLQG